MKKSLFTGLALSLLLSVGHAQVVATVNGSNITNADVAPLLNVLSQGRYGSLKPAQQAQLQQMATDQAIDQQLVFEHAKKEGFQKKKIYQEEREKAIAALEKRLTVDLWVKELADSVKVSDKDLKAYYNKNKEYYVQQERVHARHILVKTNDEAKALINELKPLKGDKLEAKFIELAKAKSTGPSGKKGGDLGFFAQGQMVPAFNDAVFAMKPNTITTSPVKTQFGFHIIYLAEKKDKSTLAFDAVKADVKNRVKVDKFKETFEKKIKALKSGAKIEYK
jgi:parvulin-like peptidyl-prolyl isomerase